MMSTVFKPTIVFCLHLFFSSSQVIREKFVSQCRCHGYSGSCSMRTCWRRLNLFQEATTTLYERYRVAKVVTLSWLMQTYRIRQEAHFQHHHPNMIVHASSRSAVSSRPRRTKLDWLGRLEAMMGTVTRLELNQPNAKRDMDQNVKVAKRDLIYVKQSVNFCEVSAHLPLKCDITSNSTTTNAADSISQFAMLNTCNTICCGRGYRSKTQPLKTIDIDCDCRFKFCCSLECNRKCELESKVEYECSV